MTAQARTTMPPAALDAGTVSLRAPPRMHTMTGADPWQRMGRVHAIAAALSFVSMSPLHHHVGMHATCAAGPHLTREQKWTPWTRCI